MNRVISSTTIAGLAALTIVVTPLAARAEQCEKDIFQANCSVDRQKIAIGLTPGQLRNLPKYEGDKGGSVQPMRDPDDPYYEYRTIANCSEAVPDTPTEEVLCSAALKGCPEGTKGPLSQVWRRTMAAGKEIEGWQSIGLTCYTDVAPGARPTITMADLKAEFMRTPWAKPAISSQPAGNITLVNLKTFYKVNWSGSGFQPGEVDTSVMRGFTVRIRPTLVGFTYVFGDGSTFGPTTSTGGVYPDGDVIHTYRTKGEFPVHVDTTFGAEFSLDGRTWDAIPATVTVAGPSTVVTVKEAKAVLVNE